MREERGDGRIDDTCAMLSGLAGNLESGARDDGREDPREGPQTEGAWSSGVEH